MLKNKKEKGKKMHREMRAAWSARAEVLGVFGTPVRQVAPQVFRTYSSQTILGTRSALF